MTVIKLPGQTRSDFADQVAEKTGQDVSRCQQCGRCTGGCPMAYAYDHSVNQIMRMILADMRREVLSCRAIWLCAVCWTCSARCPAGIDVTRVMEGLRHMARAEGLAPEKDIKIFAESFVETLARHGRMHEVELILRQNLLTGRPFHDADLAPSMLLKSKIHLRSPKIAGREAVSRIVDRWKAREAEGAS